MRSTSMIPNPLTGSLTSAVAEARIAELHEQARQHRLAVHARRTRRAAR